MTTQLRLREIRIRGLNLTLDRPIETAAGVMATTPIVLIDVLTHEGICGRSYVRCYTPTVLEPLVRLLSNLEELLKDDDAAPLFVEKKLQRHFRLIGPQGLTGIAIGGIDMALWDARAKACGVPLVTLLGGTPKAIPAYASLRAMEPGAAAEEAQKLAAAGFSGIKLKIGGKDLASDLETIHTVRRAVGETVKLMVDYNQSLSVNEALDRIRLLDEEGLYWIEEPTRADDYAGHARIAAAAQTAIQLGENWWGPHDVQKSLEAGASDHVMFDVMKIGGVTGWIRAAALAEASGRPASSHAFVEFSAHLLGVTPTAHYLEYLDHAAPILEEPIRIEGGCALIPNRAGAGLEWNEALIRRQQTV